MDSATMKTPVVTAIRWSPDELHIIKLIGPYLLFDVAEICKIYFMERKTVSQKLENPQPSWWLEVEFELLRVPVPIASSPLIQPNRVKSQNLYRRRVVA